MTEAIGDASQHHPLRQARPPLADDDEPCIALLGYRDEPGGRVAELFGRLVIDAVETEMLLGLSEDLLLALDQGRGQRLRRGRCPTIPRPPSGGRTTVTNTSLACRERAISAAISAARMLVSEPSTPTTIAFRVRIHLL